MSEVTIRQETDIDTLMRWRKEVVSSVFDVDMSDWLVSANHEYYRRHLPDGSHFAVVAFSEGAEAGCGGVCFSEELPSPDNQSGKCAYLMNIYVREPFRRKGIGREIVRALVAEACLRGCGKISLETTAQGYPLYRSAGFERMEGMMKATSSSTST